MLATFLITTLLAQDPNPAAFAGVWVLESISINGEETTKPQKTELLKEFGGIEIGCRWKLRTNGFGATSDVEMFWEYYAATKELCIVTDLEGKGFERTFDLKRVGEKFHLRYKERDKTVILTFASEK